MAYLYEKQKWEAYNDTLPEMDQPNSVITTHRLNHMEDGIQKASSDIEVTSDNNALNEQGSVSNTYDSENKLRKIHISFPKTINDDITSTTQTWSSDKIIKAINNRVGQDDLASILAKIDAISTASDLSPNKDTELVALRVDLSGHTFPTAAGRVDNLEAAISDLKTSKADNVVETKVGIGSVTITDASESQIKGIEVSGQSQILQAKTVRVISDNIVTTTSSESGSKLTNLEICGVLSQDHKIISRLVGSSSRLNVSNASTFKNIEVFGNTKQILKRESLIHTQNIDLIGTETKAIDLKLINSAYQKTVVGGSSKNLFGYFRKYDLGDDKNITVYGSKITVNGKSIVDDAGKELTLTGGKKISLDIGDYTLSIHDAVQSPAIDVYVVADSAESTILASCTDNISEASFSISSPTKVTVAFAMRKDVTYTNTEIGIQLESGTIPTEYSEYLAPKPSVIDPVNIEFSFQKGEDVVPINTSKNLWVPIEFADMELGTTISTYNGVTEVNGYISKTQDLECCKFPVGSYSIFRKGRTYTLSTIKVVNRYLSELSVQIELHDTSVTPEKVVNITCNAINNPTRSFTIDFDEGYIVTRLVAASDTIPYDEAFKIQLEEGPTATSFSAYEGVSRNKDYTMILPTLYSAKIGESDMDCGDTIFKEGSEWKISKGVDKLSINASDFVFVSDKGTENTYVFKVNPNLLTNYNTSSVISTHFLNKSNFTEDREGIVSDLSLSAEDKGNIFIQIYKYRLEEGTVASLTNLLNGNTVDIYISRKTFITETLNSSLQYIMNQRLSGLKLLNDRTMISINNIEHNSLATMHGIYIKSVNEPELDSDIVTPASITNPSEVTGLGVVNSNKYNLNIGIYGKNIFDTQNITCLEGVSATTDSSGDNIISFNTGASNTTASRIKVCMMNNDTVSGTLINASSIGNCNVLIEKDKNFNYIGIVLEGAVKSAMMKVDVSNIANSAKIVLSFNLSSLDNNTAQINHIQIEFGEVMTGFENPTASFKTISIDSPLYKIREYKDILTKKFNSWGIERHVKKVVFNGTENWTLESSDATSITFNTTTFLTNASNLNNLSTGSLILSNKLGYCVSIDTSTLSYPCVGYTKDSNFIKIKVAKTDLSANVAEQNLTSFLSWLSTNNIEVYYILSTPVFESLADSEKAKLDTLSIKTDNSNVMVSSNLETDIAILYEKKVKEEISDTDIVTPTPQYPTTINGISNSLNLIVYGKNIFDMYSMVNDNPNIENCYEYDRSCYKVTNVSYFKDKKLKVKFKKNTQYTICADILYDKSIINRDGLYFACKYTDGTISRISTRDSVSVTWVSSMWVSQENKSIDYIYMDFDSSDVITYLDMEKISVCEGVNTQFESTSVYSESTIPVTQENMLYALEASSVENSNFISADGSFWFADKVTKHYAGEKVKLPSGGYTILQNNVYGIEKNIKKLLLTGEETWIADNKGFLLSNTDVGFIESLPVISNIVPIGDARIRMESGVIHFDFINEFKTVESWKKYLSDLRSIEIYGAVSEYTFVEFTTEINSSLNNISIYADRNIIIIDNTNLSDLMFSLSYNTMSLSDSESTPNLQTPWLIESLGDKDLILYTEISRSGATITTRAVGPSDYTELSLGILPLRSIQVYNTYHNPNYVDKDGNKFITDKLFKIPRGQKIPTKDGIVELTKDSYVKYNCTSLVKLNPTIHEVLLTKINDHNIACFTVDIGYVFTDQDVEVSKMNVLGYDSVYDDDAMSDSFSVTGGKLSIRIDSTFISTVDQFKSYLNANDVYILYPLKSRTSYCDIIDLATDTALNEITLYPGTNKVGISSRFMNNNFTFKLTYPKDISQQVLELGTNVSALEKTNSSTQSRLSNIEGNFLTGDESGKVLSAVDAYHSNLVDFSILGESEEVNHRIGNIDGTNMLSIKRSSSNNLGMICIYGDYTQSEYRIGNKSGKRIILTDARKVPFGKIGFGGSSEQDTYIVGVSKDTTVVEISNSQDNIMKDVRIFGECYQSNYRARSKKAKDFSITDNHGNTLGVFEVYGKTTQDGVPSVDNPISTKSVAQYDTSSIDLCICEKNLAINSYKTGYLDSNTVSLYINAVLEPNTYYTISFKETGDIITNQIILNDKIFIAQDPYTITKGSNSLIVRTVADLDKSKTDIYDQSNGWLIFKNAKENSIISFNDVQIEKGQIENPSYVAYSGQNISIPLISALRGIGNVKDRVFNRSGIWSVERNIKSKTLIGSSSEKYTFSIDESNPQYIFVESDSICADKLDRTPQFFNRFESVDNALTSIKECASVTNSVLYIRLLKSRLENSGFELTLAGFKRWLLNNPLIIQYISKIPTYDELSSTPQNALNNLTLPNSDIINIGTTNSYKPEMYIEYRCKLGSVPDGTDIETPTIDHQAEIKMFGDKTNTINFVACGRNICLSSETISTSIVGNFALYIAAPIKPDTVYTLSFDHDSVDLQYINLNTELFTIYDGGNSNIVDGKLINGRNILVVRSNTVIPRTRNEVSRLGIFKVGSGTTSPIVFNNLQIELGNTVHEYEDFSTTHTSIAIPNSLRGISGEIADMVMNRNGSYGIRKTIEKVIFNGSENWMLDSEGQTTICFSTANFLTNAINYNPSVSIISDRLKYTRNIHLSDIANTIGYSIDGNYLKVRISKTKASDLAQFKSLLSTKNIVVYYVLKSSVFTELSNEINTAMNALRLRNVANIFSYDNDENYGSLRIEYHKNKNSILDSDDIMAPLPLHQSIIHNSIDSGSIDICTSVGNKNVLKSSGISLTIPRMTLDTSNFVSSGKLLVTRENGVTDGGVAIDRNSLYKAGEKYTLRFKIKDIGNSMTSLSLTNGKFDSGDIQMTIDGIPQVAGAIDATVDFSDLNYHEVVATFTANGKNSYYNYIAIKPNILQNNSTGYSYEIIELKVEPGVVATTWTPPLESVSVDNLFSKETLYMDSPLRSIGEYSDSVDRVNNSYYTKRKIGYIDFALQSSIDANQITFVKRESPQNDIFEIVIPNMSTAENVSFLCTAFKYSNKSEDSYKIGYGYCLNTSIIVNFSDYWNFTVEEFKSWLTSNNVKMYYVLKDSVISEISIENDAKLKRLTPYTDYTAVYTGEDLMGDLNIEYYKADGASNSQSDIVSPTPFYKSEITPYGNTGDIDITVCDKNIFKSKLALYSTNYIYPENINSADRYKGPCNTILLPNTKYTISFNETSVDSKLFLYDKDNKETRNISLNNIKTLTFTTTANECGFSFYRKLKDLIMSNYRIQLEFGDIATTISNYNYNSISITLSGPQALKRVGKYRDKLFKFGGEYNIKRSIAEVILKETSNITLLSSNDGIYEYEIGIANARKTNTECCTVSSHFKGISADSKLLLQDVVYTSNDGILRILTKEFSTASNFKSWLTDNNVHIYYVLESPVYEAVSAEYNQYLKSITINQTLSNVQVYNALMDSDISVQYYKNSSDISDTDILSPSPDYKSELDSVGSSGIVTVCSCSVNILNGNVLSGVKFPLKHDNFVIGYKRPLYIPTNRIYYNNIFFNDGKVETPEINMVFYRSDGSYLTCNAGSHIELTTDIVEFAIITTPAGYSAYGGKIISGVSLTFENVNEYSAYAEEVVEIESSIRLYKLGIYRDKIIQQDGIYKILKNINTYTMTGNEIIIREEFPENSGNYRFVIKAITIECKDESVGFCDNFKYSNKPLNLNDEDHTISIGLNGYIYLRYDNIETVVGLQKYLQSVSVNLSYVDNVSQIIDIPAQTQDKIRSVKTLKGDSHLYTKEKLSPTLSIKYVKDTTLAFNRLAKAIIILGGK